jgi:hypothetical protein
MVLPEPRQTQYGGTMRIEPELGGCSIVLVGHFNPRIFLPPWFAQNKVVSETEANQAEITVVHSEITVVRIGKIRIQADLGRFVAESSEASWIDLSDFVERTFDLLVHTPINQMGINRYVHFSVGDEETRNRIGNMLAPLEPWGAWGAQIGKGVVNGQRGGCINLTMHQPKPPGSMSGHVQVQVQPSNRISAGAGIFVQVNDHYFSGPIESTIEAMMDELKNFERSIRRSEELIDQVMSLKERI